MRFFDKEHQGKIYKFYALRSNESLWIHYQGQTWLWKNQKTSSKQSHKSIKTQGLITSPMPGRIQKMFVQKGDTVQKGQNLLVLSAMKIEYSFKAEDIGSVEDIFCQTGQTVSENHKLIKIKYN